MPDVALSNVHLYRQLGHGVPDALKGRAIALQRRHSLGHAARRYHHVRAFIVLSLATGARQTAMLDLTWDRVDFARLLISLPLNDNKDEQRKRRAVFPMNKRADRYLRVMRASAQSDHVIEWGGRRA